MSFSHSESPIPFQISEYQSLLYSICMFSKSLPYKIYPGLKKWNWLKFPSVSYKLLKILLISTGEANLIPSICGAGPDLPGKRKQSTC